MAYPVSIWQYLKYLITPMTIWLNTTLVFTFLLFSAWPALLQMDQTRLYLQNVPLQDEKLLIVNLVVADVADLYGAELQLRYNPAQLQVRDNDPRLEGIQIKPGPLIDFGDRFVVQNSANSETGLIDFAFTLLRSAEPINGEGVLATVVFEILGGGPFTVEISAAQLVASTFTAIPVATSSLLIEDAEGESGPAASVPQWRQWQTVLLVSVPISLILLILIIFSLSQRRLFQGSASAPVRRMPGSVGASVRSAALLAQQGHRAVAQGDPARAYELFSQAIELDPANTDAWLGKGLVAQQPTEKRICLQRVLALDPENSTAKNALAQLS
ncbi:MAG TPA: cohesin domain-containing protein [Anaerolineae bacterium]|nr:cohesin domain-containing protein [Anaerolineae bacterium]